MVWIYLPLASVCIVADNLTRNLTDTLKPSDFDHDTIQQTTCTSYMNWNRCMVEVILG